MFELLGWILFIAVLACFWTIYTLKRDGYFGKSPYDKVLESKKNRKRGSIVFFKDGAKHVKH
ncbi:MAG: hypothetical protein U0525_06210 [Patescibacteria group bacterium]